MAVLDSEAFEKLEETLEEIRKVSAEGATIIVEGTKDEKSLRKLGVSGPISQVPNEGKTPLNSLEELSDCEEVVILTDFDRTGEELAKFCKRHFEKLGVTVLFKLRKRLKKFLRKSVKDIEGMSSFIESERASQSGYNLENILDIKKSE